MKKCKTIAIDIDGTIRDFNRQVMDKLEDDYPKKAETLKTIINKKYRSLDQLFDTLEDLHSWMYDERVFEIFGMAPRLHPKIVDDLNIFKNAAEQQGYKVIIASVQRGKSITATLHWLSKWGCTISSYQFFNNTKEKIDANFDVYVDDCPEVLTAIVNSKSKAIKIPYEFNEDINCPELDIKNGKFDDIYELLNVERVLKK